MQSSPTRSLVPRSSSPCAEDSARQSLFAPACFFHSHAGLLERFWEGRWRKRVPSRRLWHPLPRMVPRSTDITRYHLFYRSFAQSVWQTLLDLSCVAHRGFPEYPPGRDCWVQYSHPRNRKWNILRNFKLEAIARHCRLPPSSDEVSFVQLFQHHILQTQFFIRICIFSDVV